MAKTTQTLASTFIALASLAAAYAPIPGVSQTLVIVSGTELQDPLRVLEQLYEQQNPNRPVAK